MIECVCVNLHPSLGCCAAGAREEVEALRQRLTEVNSLLESITSNSPTIAEHTLPRVASVSLGPSPYTSPSSHHQHIKPPCKPPSQPETPTAAHHANAMQPDGESRKPTEPSDLAHLPPVRTTPPLAAPSPVPQRIATHSAERRGSAPQLRARSNPMHMLGSSASLASAAVAAAATGANGDATLLAGADSAAAGNTARGSAARWSDSGLLWPLYPRRQPHLVRSWRFHHMHFAVVLHT